MSKGHERMSLSGGTWLRTPAPVVSALLVLLLAADLLLTPALAWGAAGDLDPSFGSGGTVTTTIGTDAGAGDVALQPDGKIVAAGYSSNGSIFRFTLARYMVAGSLDASFGSGGTVATAVGSFDSVANAVALQPDGKILAAGSSDTCVTCGPFGQTCCGTGRFAVARYTAAGGLDASFGSGGKVITVIGANDAATDIALQPDGSIVVAGISWVAGANRFALARYTAAGVLDASFGSGGTVTTAIGTNAIAMAVALQPDGKIVVAGYAEAPGTPTPISFALARYTTTGDLDATFGSGGTVTTFITQQSVALAAALQPDGKIVAAGLVHYSGSPHELALARYLADGSLDASFGSGGTVTTAIGTGAAVDGVALQSDGKIVAAGFSYNGSARYFTLARYTPAGSLDASFGSGGTVTTPIGPTAAASSVALQPDGKIVAAGVAYGSPDQFALARYLGDCGNGVLDPGEACDDGNAANGDCCSATCQLDPPGTSCDDRNPCTVGESCDEAGVCGGFTSCRTNTTCNICGSQCTLQAGACRCG